MILVRTFPPSPKRSSRLPENRFFSLCYRIFGAIWCDMQIPYRIENAFYRISDFFIKRLPQPVPDANRIANTRLIAHRGIFDNKRVFENTLSAFEPVKAHGIWGIEFDIRWTKDLHPVVFHDPNCRRLFNRKAVIREMSLKEVTASFPRIPTLADVIKKYGKALHFMVELKERFTAAEHQNQRLCDLFAGLTPSVDFHLMSLSPQIFNSVIFVPPEAMIPIAELNAGKLADMALRKKYSGVAGHYLLMRNPVLKKMSQQGRRIGTGFVNSMNCCYREVNRGVTWLFSDRAMAIQQVLGRPPRRHRK